MAPYPAEYAISARIFTGWPQPKLRIAACRLFISGRRPSGREGKELTVLEWTPGMEINYTSCLESNLVQPLSYVEVVRFRHLRMCEI